MSAQEERQQIIRENLPILIEHLTCFDRNEENFKQCEHFALHTIRNHKNLSVNSHEIKRRIDGMQEKFIVGNYQKHADYLKKLYEEIINHPLCLNHYEIDVHWSILEFLLSLSYNPVGSLRKNNIKIPIQSSSSESANDVLSENNVDQWVKLLKEDAITLEKEHCDDDSELSEWTNSDSEISEEPIVVEDKSEQLEKQLPRKIFSDISPPKRQLHYKLFDDSNSKDWLTANIQHSWWSDKCSNYKINSSHYAANFCHLWNEFLTQKSNNLIKLKQISTASEYVLLREIIWMFQSPTNNKFFTIDEDEIHVRENVSIPSVTVEGLCIFLESIIPYIKMANNLRKFINSVYCYEEKRPPKIYEFYAPSLQKLLDIFYEELLKEEEKIKNEELFQIYTVIVLRKNMETSFQFLENIYKIHSSVVLDFKTVPAHICSAHLLAGLLYQFDLSSCQLTSNLTISLFLSTVQVFCNIIDNWWTEGQLDDWRNEFVVEKTDYSDEIRLRPYKKSRERSFFVAGEVSSVIQRDCFIKLLMQHSLEAGCTLNLLYQINKIGKLKSACNYEKNLYETLIEDVFLAIEQFQDHDKSIEEPRMDIDSMDSNMSDENFSKSNGDIDDFAYSVDDDFLLMVFHYSLMDANSKSENLDGKNNNNSKKKFEITSTNIFEKLNKVANSILPLKEIILKCVKNILQSRISFANEFVMNLYRDEFEIAKHLQNIRRILLLESSDLMHAFYVKLFLQIESNKAWANPFQLTVQLDDILCSKFPDMSSLFRIEIDANLNNNPQKVTEAVDEIYIKYNMSKELKNVISEASMEEYNKVFRFLLKVKWAMWSLENLHFPIIYKRRPPYAEFEMKDLLMRRLEQLRFWLMYCVQCVHFHLMTYVLHSMSKQLNKKIENCKNLSELKSVHDSYIKTICQHCFTENNSSDVKVGIEQILNLVNVLRMEWKSYEQEMDSSNCRDCCDGENDPNYALSTQLGAIENTYIRCHQYLAKILSNEVYIKQNTYLSGLSAAFNTSLPY